MRGFGPQGKPALWSPLLADQKVSRVIFGAKFSDVIRVKPVYFLTLSINVKTDIGKYIYILNTMTILFYHWFISFMKRRFSLVKKENVIWYIFPYWFRYNQSSSRISTLAHFEQIIIPFDTKLHLALDASFKF